MAHLEGSLPAAVAAEFSAHLEACASCRAEAASLRALEGMLESAGERAQSELPAVDVLAGVLSGLADIRAGRRSVESLLDEREDVIAYLDGELDDFSVARLERERGRDAAFDAELEALAGLGAELDAIGVTAAASVPRVDLVANVLAQAKARAVETEALPEVISSLPEGVRLAAERFIEGEATDEQAAALREYAAGQPALAALMDDYTALHAELDALAADAARAVPRIDIVAEVTAAVRRQARDTRVTPMRRPASATPVAPRSNRLPWIGFVAAAACAVFALYSLGYLPGSATEPAPVVAKATPTPALQGVKPVDAGVSETLRQMDGEGEPLATTEGAADVPEVDPAAGEPVQEELTGNAARSLKDVLDIRQKAMMNDQDALAKLMRWSTLSEKEARKILEDKTSSPAAILAALEFLPSAEQAGYLKGAVERNPNDPYLRKALAKAYAENGDVELAKAELEAWSKLDPENSMPKYLAARLAFEGGDAMLGLSLMEEAAAFNSGTLYSTQTASNRRSALGATGYNNDVATFLAGSTAGTGEYQYTNRLAGELMAQGDQLRDEGNYEDAQKVYLGVYNLGAQLSNSAQLANDYAGAYDIQRAALEALTLLAQVFGGVDLNSINGLVEELNGGMAALTQLMQLYNQIFESGDLTQILNFLQQTLSGGQLGALQ